MKKIIIAIALLLAGFATQINAEQIFDGEKIIEVSKKREKANDPQTPYPYTQEKTGKTYPTFINKNGKVYADIISKNGNQYRKYMDEKTSRRIAKIMGIEYVETKKKANNK